MVSRASSSCGFTASSRHSPQARKACRSCSVVTDMVTLTPEATKLFKSVCVIIFLLYKNTTPLMIGGLRIFYRFVLITPRRYLLRTLAHNPSSRLSSSHPPPMCRGCRLDIFFWFFSSNSFYISIFVVWKCIQALFYRFEHIAKITTKIGINYKFTN